MENIEKGWGSFHGKVTLFLCINHQKYVKVDARFLSFMLEKVILPLRQKLFIRQNMKPIVEVSKFADGRMMVRVRFSVHSNFWIHDLEQATWVPTLEEVSFLKEVLDVTNEHNEIRRALGRAPKDRVA
jgi:hypothetical protein